jgi:hypothetical protein
MVDSYSQKSDESASESGSKNDSEEMSEKTFLFSDKYDLSKTEEEIDLINDIIRTAALMAIYMRSPMLIMFRRLILTKILSHLMLLDWNVSADDVPFEALSWFSGDFQTCYTILSLEQELDLQDWGQDRETGR